MDGNDGQGSPGLFSLPALVGDLLCGRTDLRVFPSLEGRAVMKRSALLVLVGGFLVAADAPKDELKKLEGTWTMESGEQKGEKLSSQVVKNAKLTIVGDKHTVKVGKDTIIGTHKVNPAKKPAEIDATDTEGPYKKGKTTLGIYKLEGDQFTVCFAPPGKDRPKEFTTKSGTGELLHIWKKK